MELPNRPVAAVVAGLVIAASLMALWFEFRTPTARLDPERVHAANLEAAAIGGAMASETIKAIQGQGQIVLVADRAPSSGDICWTTFLNEIKQHPSITIDSIETVDPDPDEPLVSSPGAMQNILQQHAQAGAIVVFANLPEWSKLDPLLAELPIAAKIVALDNHGLVRVNSPFSGNRQVSLLIKVYYGGYFERGILFALIAHRPPAGATGTHLPPREWFDQHYQTYTPENYGLLQDAKLPPQTGPSSRP